MEALAQNITVGSGGFSPTREDHADLKKRFKLVEEEIFESSQEDFEKMVEKSGWRLDNLVPVIRSWAIRNQRAKGYLKFDAGETGMIERQLYYIYRTMDVIYPLADYAKVVNVKTDLPLGASHVVVPSFDKLGQFEPLSPGADDLPVIDVYQTETFKKIMCFGAKISYNIQELERINYSGQPVETKRMEALQFAWQAKLDQVACTGATTYGIYGLANDPDGATVTPAASGLWSAKSANEILEDIQAISATVEDGTNHMIKCNALALPPSYYTLLANKLMASSTTPVNVLGAIQVTCPWITKIVTWGRLATAATDGGSIVVGYNDQPLHSEFMCTELKQLDMQERGLRFEMPCYGYTTGNIAYSPKSLAYLEDV